MYPNTPPQTDGRSDNEDRSLKKEAKKTELLFWEDKKLQQLDRECDPQQRSCGLNNNMEDPAGSQQPPAGGDSIGKDLLLWYQVEFEGKEIILLFHNVQNI